MSAQQVRELMNEYVEALLSRGDFGRFFARDVHFEIVGTDQRADGAAATEQMIRFLHEIAFDAHPEPVNVLVDDHGAAAEAVFAGTHTGEFAGIGPSGNAVRVPYSAFYTVDDGRIGALRIYMSLEQLVAQISAPAHAATAG